MAETADAAAVKSHPCSNMACGSTDATMKCPNCLKLNLEGGFFCGQACFKSSWKWHKLMHNEAGKLPDVAPVLPDFDFSGPLRPGVVVPGRFVPPHIARPDYAVTGQPASELAAKGAPMTVRTPAEIASLRVCCRLAREVLDICGNAVRPGITTDEIDRICHEAIIERNAYPSPLNYHYFPKSICTSPNEIICHGIPDSRELKDGDIVNLDITLYYDGVHGDLNETFLVGNSVSQKHKDLVKTAYDAMMAGVGAVKPGVMYREIGKAISKTVNPRGFSVVRSYCGHGIGPLFHCVPNIPHYHPNKCVGNIKVGHVFTIEPMINEGAWQDITWEDQWTSSTADGMRSAQFEHTMLVTENGVDLLTARTDKSVPFWWDVESKAGGKAK